MKIFSLEESLLLIKYHKELQKAKHSEGYISEKELHNALFLIDEIYKDFNVIGEKRSGR